MERHERWIIEARNEDGSLSFERPQPEDVFGMGAISGMSDDAMAKAIFRRVPEASLSGEGTHAWPRLIDPRFTARRKTW